MLYLHFSLIQKLIMFDKLKSYYFITLNIIGNVFSMYALGVIVAWIFKFHDYYIPQKYNMFGAIFIMSLIVSTPIISLIILRFWGQFKFGKFLGFTYLALWLVVMIRMFTLLN